MARKKSKFGKILLLLILIAILCAAYYVYTRRNRPPEPLKTGELGIHFLELGNKYVGDCVYIRIGDVDILVDGGSRTDSADTIAQYLKGRCTDGILEYVIVTHAHQDHIAAFAGDGKNESLFRRFVCKCIIDFPLTDSDSRVYRDYVRERDAEVEAGAKHYTALECYNNLNGAARSYELAENVSLNVLYNYYYDHKTGSENNYSVCFTVTQGTNTYLFTGDLESAGERLLTEYNSLPRCKLFKAGHHGSSTSNTDALLSVIRPEYVCICTCAGSPEYSVDPLGTFPTQETIDRLARYTDKIYVTTVAENVVYDPKGWTAAPLNGDILFRSDGLEFSVTGSNHSLPLKDTPWFRANRTWPS